MRSAVSKRHLREPETVQCPYCKKKKLIINKLFSKESFCEECNSLLKSWVCSECFIKLQVCGHCGTYDVEDKDKEQAKETSEYFDYRFKYFFALALISIIVVLILWMFPILNSGSSEDLLKSHLLVIQPLKNKFPSQSNHTWNHILSVLNMEVPTVKSLLLLHEKDNSTAVCLVKELISMFTGRDDWNQKEIFFENMEDRVTSYGEVLEFYRPVVKKHRILLTNLNQVSANIAKVFHFLCDETSSDIKPSRFIFTLEFGEQTRGLKPLQRAEKILWGAWGELPESQISALLSRVVKNVAEVAPEDVLLC